ncbi:MAG: hypothetical protein JWQ88_2302 [Rhodoferax sp.]|nr:hypothetical protein [Rhodoferax sp.]
MNEQACALQAHHRENGAMTMPRTLRRARPLLPFADNHQLARAGRWIGPALVALALAGCANPWKAMSPGADRRAADAQPRDVPPGIVSVVHADPASFSEARLRPQESPRARQAWLDEICIDLSDRAAAALAPGQRLEVKITDVRRADPPAIELDFRLLTADGRLLRQGHRQLRSTNATAGATRPGRDLLQNEKALTNEWVAREFGPGR